MVAFLAVALAFAFLAAWRPWLYASAAGPARRGVATIAAVQAGVHGEHGASFTYRVTLDDGTEGDISLPVVFSPRTRLRLAYNRGWHGQLNVLAYQECRGDCAP